MAALCGKQKHAISSSMRHTVWDLRCTHVPLTGPQEGEGDPLLQVEVTVPEKPVLQGAVHVLPGDALSQPPTGQAELAGAAGRSAARHTAAAHTWWQIGRLGWPPHPLQAERGRAPSQVHASFVCRPAATSD